MSRAGNTNETKGIYVCEGTCSNVSSDDVHVTRLLFVVTVAISSISADVQISIISASNQIVFRRRLFGSQIKLEMTNQRVLSIIFRIHLFFRGQAALCCLSHTHLPASLEFLQILQQALDRLPVFSAKPVVCREDCSLRHSRSVEEFHKPPTMQMHRSSSDNHLLLSNQIRATLAHTKLKSNHAGLFSFRFSSSILLGPIHSLWFKTESSSEIELVQNLTDNYLEAVVREKKENEKRSSWVERLVELRIQWMDRQKKEVADGYGDREGDDDSSEGVCEVDSDEEEEVRASLDSELFLKLLARVSWSDTKRFSQLAFLCNMAYAIPEIKDGDLRRYYGLRFKTSSLEKKAEAVALKTKLDMDPKHIPAAHAKNCEMTSTNQDRKQHQLIQPSVAYEIAVSAASHIQHRVKGGNSDLCGRAYRWEEEELESRSQACKSEMAAYMAASTMTAVVAAREKEKQEAAKDLQSLHSSPCEWFICDDPGTHTRTFVIQGSESLASWQANLFFEPTKFEGTEVLVHRGIYEAAKGIYQQFLPEIHEHLNACGDEAKLQFTGHSLGGSLSLLVHLMLVARGVVTPSTLLPVVTFGSPFVFCGGQKILNELGLDESQVHCVIMHRDIVPRAFTCNYPNHVVQVLKRLNGSFRSHPCLNKHKLLYSPLGQIFILQPEENSSPSHPLLPPGSALYAMEKTRSNSAESALRKFLNTPHPLETLSDPTAYGSEGTILRDHESINYLKAVNGVLRQYTKMVVRKVRKERHLMWPLLTTPTRKEILTRV
ncbi:hypothetical protein Nepgr_002267 [Nepenthes gracilis]|uniref:Fungal lipase-type domain-containing protein n=1 Tax=Nepenthes gracilis TaxID=150966 RepID=A0AAD3P8K7_NEPGR|nr:hypothetical protein Nepgr_002267 [Nepenthes gracilis]